MPDDTYDENHQDFDLQAQGDSQSTGASNSSTGSNAEKDPKDWVTGDEPATGAQMSYAQTMAQQADEELPEEMTKAEASEKIEELQDKTGRG